MSREDEEMMGRDTEIDANAAGDAPQWPNAVTLVLASASARQRRWAIDTAIEVTRKLAASRAKVIIADLQRDQPSPLISALGIAPGAGIVDVLFRGASFSTVARRPEDESFFVLPLGDDPPAGGVLLQHGRWRKIAARLPDADAHLLPCVTAEDWLEAGPIPGFEACLILNGRGVEVELPSGAHQLAEFLAPPEIREEAAPTAAVPVAEIEPEAADRDRPPEDPADQLEEEPVAAAPPPEVEGEWAPPPPVSDDEPEPAVGAEPEPTGGVESEPATGLESERSREAVAEEPTEAEVQLSEPVGGGSMDDAGAETLSPGFSARRGPDRRGLLAGVVIVIAALLGLAAWQLLGGGGEEPERPPLEAAGPAPDTLTGEPSEEPGARAEDETAVGAGDEPAPVEAAAAGEATEPTTEVESAAAVALPYSVAIASYSSFEDAMQRQRRWAREDVRFYVAPTVVRGVVYYRVFAGLLPDRQEAERLMEELVRAGVKDTVRDWDVRPARLAFSFGTYRSEREARSSAETLEGRGIPTYVVEVPASGAEMGYRVYAGGYERAEDARPLRERITEAGLDVELVERVGVAER